MVSADQKLKQSPALETIKDFLAKREADAAGASARQPLMSGYLRKTTAGGLRTKHRWVVLDAGTGSLLYFKDRTEAELKGILRLPGASCSAAKSRFGPCFEIVAAAGDQISLGSGHGTALPSASSSGEVSSSTALPRTPSRPSMFPRVDGFTQQLSTPSHRGSMDGPPPTGLASSTTGGAHSHGRRGSSAGLSTVASMASSTHEYLSDHSRTHSSSSAVEPLLAQHHEFHFDGIDQPPRLHSASSVPSGHRASTQDSEVAARSVVHSVTGIDTGGSLGFGPDSRDAPSTGSVGAAQPTTGIRPEAAAAAAATATSSTSRFGSFFNPSGSGTSGTSSAAAAAGGGGRARADSATNRAQVPSTEPSAVSSGPLNPLHASKRVYVWICEHEEERDRWVAAVQAVTQMEASEARAMKWSKAFSTAPSLPDYCGNLLNFAHQPSSISIQADWVRVHMAVATNRGAGGSVVAAPDTSTGSRFNPVAGTTKLLSKFRVGGARQPVDSGTGKSVASDLAMLHSIGSDGQSNATTMATPRNKKVTRALETKQKEAHVAQEAAKRAAEKQWDSHKAVALAVAAEEAEASHESFRRAVAQAEVSAARRRVGYAPGERVPLKQVTRDYARESVNVDGMLVDNADAVTLVAALSNRVVAALSRRIGFGSPTSEVPGVPHARRMQSFGSNRLAGAVQAAGGRGGGASASSRTSSTVFDSMPSGSAVEARLVAFARNILACSSRTVAGGDTYDALELLFRNPDMVLLTADSVTAPTPVEMKIGFDGDRPDHGNGIGGDENGLCGIEEQNQDLPTVSDRAATVDGDSGIAAGEPARAGRASLAHIHTVTNSAFYATSAESPARVGYGGRPGVSESKADRHHHLSHAPGTSLSFTVSEESPQERAVAHPHRAISISGGDVTAAVALAADSSGPESPVPWKSITITGHHDAAAASPLQTPPVTCFGLAQAASGTHQQAASASAPVPVKPGHRHSLTSPDRLESSTDSRHQGEHAGPSQAAEANGGTAGEPLHRSHRGVTSSSAPKLLLSPGTRAHTVADLLSKLRVQVRVVQRYRVIPVNPDEAEDALVMMNDDGGVSGACDLGAVIATFSRTFPWDGPAPPATIAMEFLPYFSLLDHK